LSSDYFDLFADFHRLATAGTDPDWKNKITTTLMEYQYDPTWLAASTKNKKLFQDRIQQSANSRRPNKMIALQSAAIAQMDTRPRLPSIPSSLPVLIIHGKLDRMVAYSESDYLVKLIKHATRFDPGSNGDQYGHFWFDYFGTEWWADEIEGYLGTNSRAKL
jgi:pimeloyl-ACP methyl ester carboxylesterase